MHAVQTFKYSRFGRKGESFVQCNIKIRKQQNPAIPRTFRRQFLVLSALFIYVYILLNSKPGHKFQICLIHKMNAISSVQLTHNHGLAHQLD